MSIKLLIEDGSKLTQFSMRPLDHIRLRLNYLYDVFSNLIEEFDFLNMVIEWGCSVYTPYRIPCLPSSLLSGEASVLSDRLIESPAGVLYFSGNHTPKVQAITLNPSLSVATSYKDKVLKAAREGELQAKVEVVTSHVKLPILVKEGDDVCILTYYDALWYGYVHSLTSLITLSYYRDSKRTFIFLPRWFNSEKSNEVISQYCSSVIEIDGIGASDETFDVSEGVMRIGGGSPWLGSLEDTPDKFDPVKFYEQRELLNAVLK